MLVGNWLRLKPPPVGKPLITSLYSLIFLIVMKNELGLVSINSVFSFNNKAVQILMVCSSIFSFHVSFTCAQVSTLFKTNYFTIKKIPMNPVNLTHTWMLNLHVLAHYRICIEYAYSGHKTWLWKLRK